MKVNMNAVLDQNDIENAIRHYVAEHFDIENRDNIDVNIFVNPNQDSSDFLTAHATVGNAGIPQIYDANSVLNGNQETEEPVQEKPKRTRRTKAQIEADNAAAAAAGTEPEPETEEESEQGFSGSSGSEEPQEESQSSSDKPPFDLAPEAKADEQKPIVVETKSPLGIFANLGSSAPPIPTAIETPPPAGAKSLFANLTKPASAG